MLTAASLGGTLALQFDGFVESDKINRGETHVVVTDGFSGNIALKAIEGAARFVTERRAFRRGLDQVLQLP